jgi:hypothetical protein
MDGAWWPVQLTDAAQLVDVCLMLLPGGTGCSNRERCCDIPTGIFDVSKDHRLSATDA